jgi:Secretion system C-terminal sorting domain
MRLYLITTVMLAMAAPQVEAQLFTPEVVGSAGEFDNSAAIQLAWTIGEPVVTTMQAGSLTITQGFHQPGEESAIAASAPTAGLVHQAMLYPNPFRTQLFVRVPSSWSWFDIEIVNAFGETVIAKQRIERDKCAIDFSTLPSGSYIARVWVKDSTSPFTYQVTRVE